MTALRYVALPTETVRALQAGSPDANGQMPEVQISDGSGVPCRHCLQDVAEGEPFLTLAHRPFPSAQPYAEVGPIFLHQAPCPRYDGADDLPPVFQSRDRVLMRGYGADDRIVYGTGQMVATGELAIVAGALLKRSDIAYVHVRSATNNCYQCRIERTAG